MMTFQERITERHKFLDDLRRVLEASSMSMRALSKQLGLDGVHVEIWLSGRANPSRFTVIALRPMLDELLKEYGLVE